MYVLDMWGRGTETFIGEDLKELRKIATSIARKDCDIFRWTIYKYSNSEKVTKLSDLEVVERFRRQ